MNEIIKYSGVVFTPEHIAEYMVNLIDKEVNGKILEPSCGHGVFIKYLIKKFDNNMIYGNDISTDYINYCKDNYKNINFTNLDYIEYNIQYKYSIIIGNPPYIRIQNIDKNILTKIKTQYPEFITGNTDIYVYFILKSLDLLNDNGKLIFIIPNAFLTNKSYIKIRRYLIENKLLEHIIQLGHKKIFDKISCYCCIIILNKCWNKEEYKYQNGLNSKIDILKYKEFDYTNINTFCKIQNGVATLCDSIFIFDIHSQDTLYYTILKDNNYFKIEKNICKNIFKVSKNKHYKIIYPYDNNKKILDIDFIQNKFPECYKYLEYYKEKLVNRDTKCWYAYGRSQSLSILKGKKIFLPLIIKDISNSFIETETELFYSGLLIEPIGNIDIKNILIKNAENIYKNSSYKNSGYYSLTKQSFKSLI